MRKTLLMSVAVFGLATGTVFAQVGTGSTQSPPSGSAGSQMPQPMNSVPAGAATSMQTSPGTALGTQPTGMAATPTMPMARPMTRAGMMRRHMRPATEQATDASTSGDMSAPPTSAYRGGAGSPLSTRATNLSSSKTRSEMGSRLPDPAASSNTPEAMLAAAQRALNQGKTGAAQEALERAETRVLSRTTDPSMAGSPDNQAMVQNISAARHALGANDVAGAKRAIEMAMSAPIPPRGPATTTTYPAGAPPMMGEPARTY